MSLAEEGLQLALSSLVDSTELETSLTLSFGCLSIATDGEEFRLREESSWKSYFVSQYSISRETASTHTSHPKSQRTLPIPPTPPPPRHSSPSIAGTSSTLSPTPPSHSYNLRQQSSSTLPSPP